MIPTTGDQLTQWLSDWRLAPVELASRLGVSRQRVHALTRTERLSEYTQAMLARVEHDLATRDRARVSEALSELEASV